MSSLATGKNEIEQYKPGIYRTMLYKAGIYHFKWIEDCEVAAEAEDLEEMKGYEINGMGYSVCEWCEEYAGEVEYASDTDSFYRR